MNNRFGCGKINNKFLIYRSEMGTTKHQGNVGFLSKNLTRFWREDISYHNKQVHVCTGIAQH